MPASQPKELGNPKRSPVKFKPLFTSAAHETGVLSAPMEVVVQFGLRTIESRRMTSSTVLPKLPAKMTATQALTLSLQLAHDRALLQFAVVCQLQELQEQWRAVAEEPSPPDEERCNTEAA